MEYYFLAVGELSDAGTFQSEAWHYIYEWLKAHADGVLFYAHYDEDEVCQFFSPSFLGRITRVEPFGGEPYSLFGYRCQMRAGEDWLELGRLRISPEDGLTHLFFYRHERLLGDIQIEDGLNFIGMKLNEEQRVKIASEIGEIEKSRELCERWKVQISRFAGREEWEPI